MKKLLIPAFAFWLSCLFPSCTSTSPNHFLKEADYRNKVEADFGQKKEILNRGNLFDIFNEDMSLAGEIFLTSSMKTCRWRNGKP